MGDDFKTNLTQEDMQIAYDVLMEDFSEVKAQDEKAGRELTEYLLEHPEKLRNEPVIPQLTDEQFLVYQEEALKFEKEISQGVYDREEIVNDSISNLVKESKISREEYLDYLETAPKEKDMDDLER